jgi:hypothetical protein
LYLNNLEESNVCNEPTFKFPHSKYSLIIFVVALGFTRILKVLMEIASMGQLLSYTLTVKEYATSDAEPIGGTHMKLAKANRCSGQSILFAILN